MRVLLVTLAICCLGFVAQADVNISENCSGGDYTECTYSLDIDDPVKVESTTWILWLCMDRDESGKCVERDRQERLHVGPSEGGYQAFDTTLQSSWHGYDVTVRMTKKESTTVQTDTYRIPRVRGGATADGFSVPTGAIEACAKGNVVGCVQESLKANSLWVAGGVLALGLFLYLGLSPSPGG